MKLPKSTDAHLEAGHTVYESTSGVQVFEFRLEADELRQIDNGHFEANSSTSRWYCNECFGQLDAPVAYSL